MAQWSNTIDWAYTQASNSVRPKDEWVTSYLAAMKHFEALEEHLSDVSRKVRVSDD